MTITLNLPDDLQQELALEAERLGMPLNEYAVEVLARSRASSRADETPLKGSDLIEYWKREGIIGSRRDIEDPVAFARELRNGNQNRARA